MLLYCCLIVFKLTANDAAAETVMVDACTAQGINKTTNVETSLRRLFNITPYLIIRITTKTSLPYFIHQTHLSNPLILQQLVI